MIGLAEVLAAVGLIVPPLLDVLPWLAPTAALGLAVLMVGAAWTHHRRDEEGMMVTGVLALLAAIVAVARFGPYSLLGTRSTLMPASPSKEDRGTPVAPSDGGEFAPI